MAAARKRRSQKPIKFQLRYSPADIPRFAAEQQIQGLRERALVSLDNNGSLQELYSKVDAVLKKIASGGVD